MRSNLVDVEVCRHAETEKAIKVSTTGLAKDAVWVPKSQCEFELRDHVTKLGALTLPEALAIEKGLV